MEKELLFGAAYYLEYMPTDRMREDMKMMKDAGMNVIRIGESTWSTWEPRDGEFDFTLLDEMLNVAEEFDMKVIVGTPSYAIPSWLAEKSDDIMVETAEGQVRYGHRQIYNITSSTFRYYIERMIRKMMEHCLYRENIIGFQLDNETKHYGVAGPAVQDMFKRYLQRKFGTVENLNKAYYLQYWSNSIGDWDDLPDMRGCINGGLAGEFEAFQRSLVTGYLIWQRSIIDEYRRDDQFVTHNLDYNWKKFGADIAQDGHSYGVQPDADHDKLAEALTVAGTDIYHPTQNALTGLEIAFGGDEMRGIKEDDPNYLVLETEAQAFADWTPYPGQLRLQAYSHLASGAKMLEYWHWHSIHNGFETYWKGLLSHDLDANPTYQEACDFGAEWKKLGYDQLVLKKKNKVALIVDNRTLTGYKWFPIDKDLSYNDVVMWTYRALYELNIECDILFEDQILGHMTMSDGSTLNTYGRDLSGYDMIVTPALYSASEELIDKLSKWTSNGGVLVSTFKSFFADRNLSVYPDKAPHNMTDVFGVTYNQFVKPERMTVDNGKVLFFAELLKPADAKGIKHHHDVLEAWKEEEAKLDKLVADTESDEVVAGDEAYPVEAMAMYDHPYWKDYAAVTRHTYGEGMAYYIGCYTKLAVLEKVLLQAAADADLDLPMDPQTEDEEEGFDGYMWPVIIRSGVNEKGEEIHYVLHYAEEPETIRNPYGKVTDLLTGRVYEAEEDMILHDWDVLVLREEE